MLARGGEIGLRIEALERAVCALPGVGIAGAVKRRLGARVDRLTAQIAHLDFPLRQRESVKVRAVVDRVDAKYAVFIKDVADARVAADRQGGIVERLVQHIRQQTADRDAVADDGDDLALVLLRDLFQHGGGAAAHVVIALGAIETEFLGAVDKGVHRLGLRPAHVAEKARLPGADVDLAQLALGAQRQRVIAADRPGREHRALQVAGVQRVDLHVAHPLGERVDLLQAERGHVAVPVPLHRAEEVALGLGVADEIDFGHVSLLLRSALIRSPSAYGRFHDLYPCRCYNDA